jgi:hypothetical protein
MNNIDYIKYFKLPIQYINNSELDSNTINELELIKTKDASNASIYESFFSSDNSNNIFSIEIAKKSAKYYTNNKKYIKNTFKLIKNSNNIFKTDYDYSNVYNTFNDIILDKDFINKYYYIDNSWFKHFNYNSYILQILSVYNISSPLLSLLLPVVFMLIPFFILKFGGIPINFNTYLFILKKVFSTHVIGHAFMNYKDSSLEKKIYIAVSLSFYIFQIYQNIITCMKFYSNLDKIHNTLFTMRDYIEHTINNYNKFELLCKNKKIKNYEEFIKTMNERKKQLTVYKNDLDKIKPWKLTTNKLLNIGHIMKCFYVLNSSSVIKETLLYSFGFNGYIDNITTTYNKYLNKEVSSCKFSKKTKFKDAYYYPLLSLNIEPIKNSYSLDKQLIITGPNAAGKTTLIKTTFINILFSQQLGLGFYKKASISIFDKLHCYLNIPDTQGRDSLFQAEARRCKNILDLVSSNNKEKHFCIFDELYSGTNPYEAISAASSFLQYLNKFNISYILTTHYIELCNIMDNFNIKNKIDKNNYKKIMNCHMDAVIDVNNQNNNDFLYKYKLTNGISLIKGGVKVLIDLKYPKEIINETNILIKNVKL